MKKSRYSVTSLATFSRASASLGSTIPVEEPTVVTLTVIIALSNSAL